MNSIVENVPYLRVEDLSVEFRTRSGTVNALENISFSVDKGEMLGIVGESGSGKSVAVYTVMGILDTVGQVTKGAINVRGLDVLGASENDLQKMRGREASIIFQSPRTALNPIRKIGVQIADVLRRHANLKRADVRAAAIDALAKVRIPDPERRYDAYPFELSGGMCQRVMIAMALACDPKLLIADEPTTGLDVTTQATIMDLIKDISTSNGLSTVLITHDLGLAAEYCDRISVMHAGHIVETAPTAALFSNPRHPYTRKLIAATPTSTSDLRSIDSIPGNLPDLRGALPACRFSARCAQYEPRCDEAPLPRLQVTSVHSVSCWNAA
ncbi:MAG: ABC transporter ATP-binding protein [Proteobacteria bacterium]|nr:ABC transporter ATP-binding protein [Pseudomonadota bacterium]